MDEMKAVEYLKEKARMTDRCNIFCEDCPLAYINNGEMVNCGCLERDFPKKAIGIVQKWAEEHPAKTMLKDFFEKHPSAPIGDFGVPNTCPHAIGYTKENRCFGSGKCYECWNRPLEE